MPDLPVIVTFLHRADSFSPLPLDTLLFPTPPYQTPTWYTSSSQSFPSAPYQTEVLAALNPTSSFVYLALNHWHCLAVLVRPVTFPSLPPTNFDEFSEKTFYHHHCCRHHTIWDIWYILSTSLGHPTNWINWEVEPFDLRRWMGGEVLISPITFNTQIKYQDSFPFSDAITSLTPTQCNLLLQSFAMQAGFKTKG